MEILISAFIIMLLRVCDVTLGTLRTILVIQSKRYHAGLVGFVEVLIWIFAMKYIVEHMDNIFNLFGYAAGFGLGTILGVTVEHKFGIGYIQVNIISKNKTASLIETLKSNNYGLTVLPGNGIEGEVSIIYSIINKRRLKSIKELVAKIDPDGFVNIQPASPAKGFMHGARK